MLLALASGVGSAAPTFALLASCTKKYLPAATETLGSASTFWVPASADALSIEIANTGPGLPAPLRERLFEPFVAAASEGGRLSHGLGLWVCYQIVRQLAGTIEVESDEAWTRFRVQLPIAAAGGPPA